MSDKSQDISKIWTEFHSIGLAIGLFSLNMTCLIYIYVILSRKIASHICKACVRSIDLEQIKQPSPTTQTHPPIDDPESSSDSDDSDDNQQSIASRQNVTYTTVNFNGVKGSGEYQNVLGKYDYVNVEALKDVPCMGKKAPLKMTGSVEYSHIGPAAATNKHKSPHHTTPKVL